ncbi:MAG: hypothetical protein LQ344_006206 [Seirophora lacunosa]|nr:MAG: hypothetical protein LQ344_006206 [Seirophora lacunosa]
MASSQNSKRLSKNPNDLVKGIQHLRPRGSYDPLPPPGGYPLPACIRRKFSFAPQLANPSMISLMPDFASSSLQLDIQLDDSEARRISRDTPTSLYVHYSLLSLPDTLISREAALARKPSLLSINSASSTPTESRRLCNDIESQQPQNQHSRSLRRVRGTESLPRLSVINTQDDSYSTSSSPTCSIDSTESSSPRTSLISSNGDGIALATSLGHHATDCASQGPGSNEWEHGLLKRLAAEVPNLFATFFIIDLQLENLVRVTSLDILPTSKLAPNEVLFYAEDLMEIPYKLLTTYNGVQRVQTLPFEGDLVPLHGCSSASAPQAPHRFIGQIDLTAFLDRELGENGDIWLMIALEESEKAGIRRSGGRPYPSPHLPLAAPHVEAERVPELVRSLHRDYFLIGYSRLPEPRFSITFTSPTLSSPSCAEELSDPGFLHWAALEGRLMTPRRFVTGVRWRTRCGRREKLYCVPMFGPADLVCWLCFLVNRELPPVWPGF